MLEFSIQVLVLLGILCIRMFYHSSILDVSIGRQRTSRKISRFPDSQVSGKRIENVTRRRNPVQFDRKVI